MSKKNFLTVVILLATFLSGCSLQSTTKKISDPIVKKASPKLLLDSCCASDEKWCQKTLHDGYGVCPDDYEKKCKNIGGSLRKEGSLSSGLTTFSCNESAPDVGKACANNSECFYTCDLNNGIINNLCNLKKTDESEYYTTKTYDCSTDKPGVCSSVPIDYNINCGGAEFKFNGKNLEVNWNHNSC